MEVADLEASSAFYDAFLGPLGWRRHFERDGTVGWGIAQPVFFISADHPPAPGFGLICFSAKGIAAVKAAWEAGVAAGGESMGEPGEAHGHGSGSYSAFLRDPDHYDIEVTVSGR
jgi:catechol 2,3-dioxygenase-like lactoylglutathione lyase family enzyme